MDAHGQLRAAHALLASVGMDGFAEALSGLDRVSALVSA
jgi:hypothetical protein